MKRTTLLAIFMMCAAANPATAIDKLVPFFFDTIQEAIDDCNDGDRVVLAKPITYSGPGNRNLDFNGLAITVEGHYGPESCIIDCGESGRAFYFHSGEGADSVITGVGIRNGRASEKGGAIYCEFSSPTITNCIIMENSAVGLLDTDTYGGGIYLKGSSPTITDCIISSNSAIYGGGIYCEDSSLTISNCVIKDNESPPEGQSAYYGGGGISCRNSSLTMSNCTISDNKAESNLVTKIGYGGGISCEAGSSAVISDCTIAGNSATSGGGISCYAASLEVIDCTISNNLALGVEDDVIGDGGGVYLDTVTYAKLSGCTISGNSAMDFGGGFQLIDCFAFATISDCTISGNSASYQESGAIDCVGSSPDIINCTVSSNEATYGVGGIRCAKNTGSSGATSTPTITNCIFEDNPWYAIFEDEYSNASLSYCLFNDNPDGDYFDSETGPQTGADAINGLAEAHDNIDGEPSFVMDDPNDPNAISGQWTADPSYDSATMRTTLTDSSASFIEGQFVGRHINANITQREQLLITANTSTAIQVVDVDDSVWKYVMQGDSYMIIDYHLQGGSVCINAGDPDFVPEPGQKDIDGHPRVANGRVDIGSDEFFNETADFNGDEAVDFLDYAILLNAWMTSEGQTGWNPLCDLSNDGTINYEDLDLFVRGWPTIPE